MKTNKDLKIFLVDDDPFCCQIYAQHLQTLGCTNVKVFEKGSDCLNSLTDDPDVIFLDHSMSTLSGLDVLKKIKRFNPDINVVFLSGQEAIETAVTALKYGAFDYIVKGPGDVNNIGRVLNKITEVQALLEETRPGFLQRIFSLF